MVFDRKTEIVDKLNFPLNSFSIDKLSLNKKKKKKKKIKKLFLDVYQSKTDFIGDKMSLSDVLIWLATSVSIVAFNSPKLYFMSFAESVMWVLLLPIRI